MVDSRVVGMSQNFSKRQLDKRTTDARVAKVDEKTGEIELTSSQVYFTAHVEGVSHSMGVNEQGARTFTTSVNFVRGVFTDGAGNLIGFPGAAEGKATDENSSSTSHADERNSPMSTVTDLGTDPDLGGFKTP